MVKNLAKTPLTAILFAAIWCFTTPFFPVSEGYGEVLAGFTMPLLGYAYIAVYGFWLSLILALVYSEARGKGVVLTLIAAVIVLFTQWVIPNVWTFIFGETTGVMTSMDLIFWILQGVIATVFLLVLALLLFHHPEKHAPPAPPHVPPKPPPAPDKYKIKVRNFIITMIVLPVIYMVLFFIAWYFILLRNNDARAFYSVGEGINTFAKYLVDMMLNDSKQIPVALINGLITVLPLILLMLQFAHKRVLFIITTVMLLLGPAVRMLIPAAVMPDAVRFALMIETAAVAVIFGVISALMMHICVFKVQPPAAAHPVPPPAKGVKPADAKEGAAAAPEADAKKAKK